MTRKELILLVSLFSVALLVRLYFIPFYRVISADGVGYVSAARELVKGNFAPLTTYGVVYPTLTALVGFLTTNTETAGRMVSAVMGSLLVFPLYLLGRDFFGRAPAVVACILIIAWPPLRSWSCEVMTQATYITLLLSWYWLLWQAFRRGSMRWAAAAGAVAGLSYLTRPESLVAFAVMVPVLLIPWGGTDSLKKRLALFALCAVSFVLMLLPFLFLVHQVTGQWQLTGKGGATLADALSEYLGRPDLKNEPGFKGIGFLDVIRSYPDFLWMNFSANMAKLFRTMVPLYMWVAVAFGFFCCSWSREEIVRRLYLLGSFAPLAIVVVFFFVGPEYLQPYLPVVFLWGANGLCFAEEKVSRFITAGTALWKPVSVIAVSLLTIFTFVAQIPADRDKPYHYSDDEGRYDQRRIGEVLKKHLPAGSKIMTRWGRIAFYAELENAGMPQTGLQEMIATAKRNGVRYIVADGMLVNARPQFEPLFLPLFDSPPATLYIAPPNGPYFAPVGGVRLHLLFTDPSSLGVAVYEVVP